MSGTPHREMLGSISLDQCKPKSQMSGYAPKIILSRNKSYDRRRRQLQLEPHESQIAQVLLENVDIDQLLHLKGPGPSDSQRVETALDKQLQRIRNTKKQKVRQTIEGQRVVDSKSLAADQKFVRSVHDEGNELLSQLFRLNRQVKSIRELESGSRAYEFQKAQAHMYNQGLSAQTGSRLSKLPPPPRPIERPEKGPSKIIRSFPQIDSVVGTKHKRSVKTIAHKHVAHSDGVNRSPRPQKLNRLVLTKLEQQRNNNCNEITAIVLKPAQADYQTVHFGELGACQEQYCVKTFDELE